MIKPIDILPYFSNAVLYEIIDIDMGLSLLIEIKCISLKRR